MIRDLSKRVSKLTFFLKLEMGWRRGFLPLEYLCCLPPTRPVTISILNCFDKIFLAPCSLARLFWRIKVFKLPHQESDRIFVATTSYAQNPLFYNLPLVVQRWLENSSTDFLVWDLIICFHSETTMVKNVNRMLFAISLRFSIYIDQSTLL